MIHYINENRIREIADNCGKNTCGSVSLCSILENWGMKYDVKEVITTSCDGIKTVKYPVEGSSVLGLLLSAFSIKSIKVTLNCNWSLDKFQKEATAPHEKTMLNRLMSIKDFKINPIMSIDEILNEMSQYKIPIIPYFVNGKDGHFSPLLGESDGNLVFAFNGNTERCIIDKDTFEKIWWNNKLPMKSCIWIEKQNTAPNN